MSATESTRPEPAWTALEARERRVLGVLLEKAATTPAAYPMTVNAIVTGCNQKNNREPLTAYDDLDVEKALGELQARKVASEIDWMGRVPKYKHHAFEWLGVNRAEMAVMTELLLRGAQQLGELRARASRMAPIEDLAALKVLVDGLLGRRLVIELTPPGRGQVVSHNLYTPAELAQVRAALTGRGTPGSAEEPGGGASAGPAGPRADTGSAPSHPGVPPGTLAQLVAEVTALRAEVDRLRGRVDALESGRAGDEG